MKSILSVIALATVVFTAQAVTLPPLTTIYQYICQGKTYAGSANPNYQPWEFIRGYALGTQSDSNSTTTTCYGQIDQTYAFLDQVTNGGYSALSHILSGDFSYVSSDVQTMTQNINNLVIQLSDQVIACQDSVKIKQLSTRTSKVSGFSNWVFTIGYGIFFDDIKGYLPEFMRPEVNQKIRSSVVEIYNIFSTWSSDPSTQRIECNNLGKQLGIFISETLEAKVDSDVPLVEAQKLN